MVHFQVPIGVDLSDTTNIPSGYISGGWGYGEITLPNPDVRDGHTYSDNVIAKTSRAGLLRTNVPRRKVQRNSIVSTYTFTMNEDQAEAAYHFFTTIASGMYIQFTDHFGNKWASILLDDEVQINYAGRGAKSSSTWALEDTYEYTKKYTMTISLKRWRLSLPQV